MTLLIVIPYRDDVKHRRRNQLATTLHRLRALYNCVVVIAEQSNDGKRFNRGAVLNAAFLVCNRMYQVHCVIFHDVDLCPSVDLMAHYVKPLRWRQVRHLAGSFARYSQEHFLGGITMMSSTVFIAANGYPNDFYGWGGEDDELRDRLAPVEIERITEGLKDLEEMNIDDKMTDLRTSDAKCPCKRELRQAHHAQRARGQCTGLTELCYDSSFVSKTFDATLQQLRVHLLIRLHEPSAVRRLL